MGLRIPFGLWGGLHGALEATAAYVGLPKDCQLTGNWTFLGGWVKSTCSEEATSLPFRDTTTAVGLGIGAWFDVSDVDASALLAAAACDLVVGPVCCLATNGAGGVSVGAVGAGPP